VSSDTTTQAQVNRAILLHIQTLTKEAQLQTRELKKHSRELGRNRRLISLGVAWALFLGLNLGVSAWNWLAASPAGRLLGIQEVAQVEEVSRASGAMDSTPLKAGDTVGQWTVTSGFGPRSSPCPGCSKNHLGIDLNTPVGVPLLMPYDGRVTCGWSDGGGTVATLTGGGPKLRLVHLSRCTPGEFRRGERVAISGNTGRYTTGPHLHLEEYSGGAPVNPTRGWVEAVLGVSSRGGGAVGGVDLDRLRVAIIGKESGGSYRAVNPDSGALGYGQVMPSNLPSWSRAAIGREVSRQEFLDSPDIQIRVINHRLGLYLQEELAAGHDKDTAIRRVASRWYSGRPHLYANTRRQTYGGREYPSIDSYTRDILRRYQEGGA
jgi:hypothetical protein